jgi:outer membrane protein insertion porin family
VTYEVVENPKLTGIEIKGNTMVPAKELLPLLRTKTGEILNTNTLQEDLDRIVKYYASKGGMIRVSDIQVNPENKLTVSISEARFSKIIITGNIKTKDKVIRRELSSKEGSLVDFNKIRAEQRRILNLGYFESITPKLENSEKPGDVIYTIELIERKKLGLASGGLGYSAVDGLMGYMDISDENLLGNGQKMKLKLELGSKGTKTYELSFMEPWN